MLGICLGNLMHAIFEICRPLRVLNRDFTRVRRTWYPSAMGNNPSKADLARQAGNEDLARELDPPAKKQARERPRCGARTASGGECRSQAGSRTDHPGYGNCAKHGGNTEAGVKAAMRLMGRDFIRKYKEEHVRFGGSRHDPSIASLTPESALLEEVRRSAAMVRFLEDRIAMWDLSPETSAEIEQMIETSYNATRSARARDDAARMQRHIIETLENLDDGAHLPALVESHAKTGIVGFTDAREWLNLYREERGHLARVSKMCIDAGVANRLVSIAEDQGRILSAAIRAVLMALDLSADQQRLVPQVVPQVLRAVATDSPIPSIPQLLARTQEVSA